MRFGLPRDVAQWMALALSASALLAGARRSRRPRQTAPGASGRRAVAFVAAAALASALLSAAYAVVYLRGGPRIIDATSYWLAARAIAEGHLAWPLPEPAAVVLGRFLIRSETAGGPAAAVIFPPGYPAVLSLGFLAGAPLAIGPLLAAALAIATYDLAARLEVGDPIAPAIPFVPALAALFSISCAALRYHTADTMSHGLAALCFTAALCSALRALDHAAAAPGPAAPLRFAALSGLAAGWLAATRPPSALALVAVLLFVLARGDQGGGGRPVPARARLGIAAVMALGALPGLALLAAHQRAATGAWASSQAVYYAVSDGPPGCFRYGFGAGVGCVGEHGDFVRHNLANGYDVLAATGTTLRRLKLHLVDPLNAEPLALFVVAGAVVAARRTPRRGRALALAPLFQIAAYAPFYFDGSYPGGGARLFADVLPIEHVLAALAFAELSRRASAPAGRSWLAFAVALPLAGFALRAGFDHALLRDREGGAPMFDPAALARAGVTRGLVFVDTDHGFNLGFDPARSDGGGRFDHGIDVRRYHGDALDRMAWEAHGRPPSYRYLFAVPYDGGRASVSVTPLLFDTAVPPGERLIEGESLWPPLSQRDAWALPEHAGGTCASASRWLAVHAVQDGSPSVRVGLPAPWLRGAQIAPRVATTGAVSGAIHLFVDGVEAHIWVIPPGEIGAPGALPACRSLPPHPVPESAARVELSLVRDSPPSEGGATSRNRPVHAGAAEGLFVLDALSVTGGKTVDR